MLRKESVMPDLPAAMRWRTDSVMPDTEITGVLAGEPVAVRTHWHSQDRRTVPCLIHQTAGKLTCGCAMRPWRCDTTVYTPIFTKTKEKIVVPCSALVGFEIKKLKPGKLITLSRSKLRCAPLRVTLPSATDEDQGWVKNLRRYCVHEIDEYLLHLWQMPELCAFFGVPFRPALGSSIVEAG
jgi:hypothetical protein